MTVEPQRTLHPFSTAHSVLDCLANLAPKVGLKQAGIALSIGAGALTVAGFIAGEKSAEQETREAVQALADSIESVRQDIATAKQDVLDTMRDLFVEEHMEALQNAEDWFSQATSIAKGLADGTSTDPDRDRVNFRDLTYADNVLERESHIVTLQDAIPSLCRVGMEHFGSLYASHGGNAVELAVVGERLKHLVTCAIAFYCMLKAPETGAQITDETVTWRFEKPFTAMTTELDWVLTRAVLEADVNVRKRLDAEVPSLRTTKATRWSNADTLLVAPPSVTGGFDGGLARVWPWLDFVVMVYPSPENGGECTYRAPTGLPGQADPAPWCGSQWQNVVVKDHGDHHWFVAWSPRPGPKPQFRPDPRHRASTQPASYPMVNPWQPPSVLDEYQWRWTPDVQHPATDPDVLRVRQAPLTARQHAWRLLTGAFGWQSPTTHQCPVPRFGFTRDSGEGDVIEIDGVSAVSLTPEGLDAALVAFARKKNPWQIAARFPGTLSQSNIPLAHLAFFIGLASGDIPLHAGWHYPLTRAEAEVVHGLTRADMGDYVRRFGQAVSAQEYETIATDPLRFHLWRPRLIRRYRGWLRGTTTYIGLAVAVA